MDLGSGKDNNYNAVIYYYFYTRIPQKTIKLILLSEYRSIKQYSNRAEVHTMA